MKTIRAWLCMAVLALAASAPAHAAFHLWTMNELYSSPDGRVQFLELTAITGGQQFMTGHMLSVTAGGVTREFTFPRDLPGDTSGRRMLIGTASFAALGVVQPDYTVPDGFFFVQGGTINFANADFWSHGALPGDGSLSLQRNGSTAVNSPQNFAGQTGIVSPQSTPADFNVQALWWADPPDSERGWGVNITHQGQILFATWFTYDANGPMWLVMSEGRRIAPNTYRGDLHRPNGPPFNASPWNNSAFRVNTPVGTATFTFTAADRGVFAYTVNGVSGSKVITRTLLAAPLPECSQSASTAGATNRTDLWWRAPGGSENGWGINISHQGNLLFVTWFTYGPDGRDMWLVMPETRQAGPDTFSGPIFRTTGPPFNSPTWNSALFSAGQPVGTATFTFTSRDAGMFSYTLDGVTQSKPIERTLLVTPVTVCR